MMKLIVFFFLAVVALASAGLLGEGPEVYSAVSTKQVHNPWATSSSSRVQTFNDYTVVAPVAAYAAPVAAYAAPVAAYAAPVAAYAAAPVATYAAPVAYAAKAYGYYH